MTTEEYDDRNEADADAKQNFEERLKQLHNTPVEDVLKEAHKKLIVDLLAKIEMGIISHQEMAVLARLLADSGLAFNGPGTTVGQPSTKGPVGGSEGQDAPFPRPQEGWGLPGAKMPIFEEDDD